MITKNLRGELSIAGDLVLEDVGNTRTEAGNKVVIAGGPADATRMQWMKLTEMSSGYSFWDHPDEDVYSEDDGEPI